MNELIAKAETYVRAHVAAHFPPTLRFHTIDHMAEVAKAVKQLATQAGLGKEDTNALRIAAWFHDSAYYLGAQGHEARSADLAAEFLRAENEDAAVIDRVRSLILATRPDAPANGELEAMIKDADLGHIAQDSYPQQLDALREEVEATQATRYKKKAWIVENIAFLEGTTFRSEAARTLWNEGRERNLAALRNTLEERAAKKQEEKSEKEMKVVTKAEQQKKKETERGVETLFRVTLNNHTRLSQIADNKANMMLSVNALIISVVLSGLGPKLDTNPELLVPSGLLVFTCVSSIITATLATRPKVTHGTTSKEDILARKANLLFFGNFHAMKLDDFKWGMNEVMNDRDYLYGSMTQDLYFLGRVLHKKYRFLHLTYTVFMIGICASVIAFTYANLHTATP